MEKNKYILIGLTTILSSLILMLIAFILPFRLQLLISFVLFNLTILLLQLKVTSQ